MLAFAADAVYGTGKLLGYRCALEKGADESVRSAKADASCHGGHPAIMARKYAAGGSERRRAHNGIGMRGARRWDATEARHHEESKKHREWSSCGVMRLRIVIKAPQRGQCQVEPDSEGVSGGDSEATEARSWRQSASRSVRKRLARNPKWRMRTKPFGNMCRKKRRRNSMAWSVITRDLLPWA